MKINTLLLTKRVNKRILTCQHLHGDSYQLTVKGGKFAVGRGGVYFADEAIKEPMTGARSIIITDAELSINGTYRLFWNGLGFNLSLFSLWYDHSGRELVFSHANDFYYYFQRPDCGIVQVYNIFGNISRTEFQYPYGSLNGAGIYKNKPISVLEK